MKKGFFSFLRSFVILFFFLISSCKAIASEHKSQPGFRDLIKPGISLAEALKYCKQSSYSGTIHRCFDLEYNFKFLNRENSTLENRSGDENNPKYIDASHKNIDPKGTDIQIVQIIFGKVYDFSDEDNFYNKIFNQLSKKYHLNYEYTQSDAAEFNNGGSQRVWNIFDGGRVALILSNEFGINDRRDSGIAVVVEYRNSILGNKVLQKLSKEKISSGDL